jgi:hypothetical protein
MLRLMTAFAALLALSGAPVVAVACQLRCASTDSAAGADTHHHSCPKPTTTVGAGLDAFPHACGHQIGEATDQALQVLTIPTLVEPVGALLPPLDDRGVRRGAVDIQSSPPRPLVLYSQLRV